jgi:transposase InsO family protein
MRKQVKGWAKTCTACQKSKVSRHTIPPASKFMVPDERFALVHIDIVHLPPSDGYRYCLTAVDRCTRWPEAWPLLETSAENVAETFFSNWVARFGCPAYLTTDQGTNFESAVVASLNRLLGVAQQRTTAYHPQSNGIVERLHRPLKAALMSAAPTRWTEALPVILLGLRNSLKEDIRATPAEMVYGTTLRLPGEFFADATSRPDEHYDPSSYICRLRDHIKAVIPVPTSAHHKTKMFVPKAFETCTHVFVRIDRVRKSLEPPYEGPFPVMKKDGNLFTVRTTSMKGTFDTIINIARLNPAFMDSSFASPVVPTGENARLSADENTSPEKTSENVHLDGATDENHVASFRAASHSTIRPHETTSTASSLASTGPSSASPDQSASQNRRSVRRKVTFNLKPDVRD